LDALIEDDEARTSLPQRFPSPRHLQLAASKRLYLGLAQVAEALNLREAQEIVRVRAGDVDWFSRQQEETMKSGIRGVMAIAASPFDSQGVFLYDELERHVDWLVRAGSHGVCWPLGYSEFTNLSHEERLRGTQVVIDAVAGRVPVLIGASAQCTPEAVSFARRASECGADAVVAMLPRGYKAANYGMVRQYYQAIRDASLLPIFVQNQGSPWAALPAATIVRLARDIDLVEYVKEEKPPQTRSCQEIMDLCGDDMSGVMSGGGGFYLIPEMKRGISGNFPGVPVVDIVVQIWDLWQAGRHEEAVNLSQLHQSYGYIWRGLPQGARKHVLVRRGVISTAHMRNSGIAQLDEGDERELDRALAILGPHFTV